ncbi:MAG: Fmu (Sun) domain-containing protein [Sphingobacteriia bacterium]|nr:MAG: Fmu (Sun) domain-containing protein [Sphingobacteriia bacterium]
MKYAENYIRSSIAIIGLYQGDMSFAVFLKNYFAANKKFGSKDRKYISQLCYNYFRLGHAADHLSKEVAIKTALFLCNDSAGEWEILFDNSWLKNWSDNFMKRFAFVQKNFPSVSSKSIFPFHQYLSKEIDQEIFSLSHCIQPDLFIRVRPFHTNAVLTALQNAQFPYQLIGDDSISLPNGTKLEGIVAIDQQVVIQDLSSQKVGEVITSIKPLSRSNTISVWDCCAASGGKSILATDVLENIELTVSDIRESILHNLKARFSRAGIKKYHSFVVDLAKQLTHQNSLSKNQYDIVICDAPCSGSGTWGRTPEQLHFFNEKSIDQFHQLQQKLVTNIIPAVKKGGYLLYITCSVFEKENESISRFIQANTAFQLIEQKLIKGYTHKADTMFVALFQH